MTVALLVSSLLLGSCATTLKGIEKSDLQTKVKVTQPISLAPERLVKANSLYVLVRNYSDVPEIAFQEMLKQKLISMGYRITPNPEEADYILVVNVLYMDYYRETAVQEMGTAGAVVGGVGGALITEGDKSKIVGAILGAMIGQVAGGVVGSAVKIETYSGVVDVEIKEKVESSEKVYRTQVGATAQQTNIDKETAIRVINEKLSNQIGEFFRR